MTQTELIVKFKTNQKRMETDNSLKAIRLFNTASRKIESFIPLNQKEVGLYACGPTVYNYAHIGNMRTYVFEDILRRTLEYHGYKVKHVMNITDVGHLQSDADQGDDKMMLASKREKKSPWEIARFYEDEFFRHSKMLNIKRPEIICRATEHIPEMIRMIEVLIEKGFGYINDGNVYFDVSKFNHYSKFAGLVTEDQIQNNRVENDLRKRNQADFVLWFSQSKFPNQIMKWSSPWGIGFPGWHIECSAMASKYVGERIDIHCGGIDHIRVHHTNEIAQSECCFGHKWVNYWLHGEFLNVENGKMSKSKGDTLTVDTLVRDGFNPLHYRYLLLTSHYKSELKFSYKSLTTAKFTLENLQERVQEWKHKEVQKKLEITDNVKKIKDQFWDSIRQDLHTPKALALAWDVVRSHDLNASEKLSLFDSFDQVFELDLTSGRQINLTAEQKRLIKYREEARLNKNWAESDKIRKILLSQGIQLKDSKDGTTWSKCP